MMFPCNKCGKGAFTVKGLCKECAPVDHARHDQWMDWTGRVNADYKADTGKDSLEDWGAFEAWVDDNSLELLIMYGNPDNVPIGVVGIDGITPYKEKAMR